MQRAAMLAIAAAIAVVLLVYAGLRDTDEEAQPAASGTAQTTATVEPGPTTTAEPATTEAETTTEQETTTEVEPPPPPPPAGPTTVLITIRGGRPVGGIARQTVQQGDRVRIVVRADVSDHVHLHGYDVMRDVAPGRPAQIVFTATIPGRFEVELEDAGLQIADLEVRP